MSSSWLADYQQSCKEQWTLMVGRHYDERMGKKREAEIWKQNVRDIAQRRVEQLQGGENFEDKARKIRDERDSALESIDQQYGDLLRKIEKLQQKEQADHERAHNEAIAARSFLNDTVSIQLVAATTSSVDAGEVANGHDASLASEAEEGRLSLSPTKDAIPATTTPKEQDQPLESRKRFSCTAERKSTDGIEQYILQYKTENRKALQESIDSRAKKDLSIDTSVSPLPTPVSMAPAADNELGVSRFITFDEVYQNGQAEHKDTIVEFPTGSRQWYILKCEEHKIRFGSRPLQGAGKHLSGKGHGYMGREACIAVATLGFRVIDCDEHLAEMNNKTVADAFVVGYSPANAKLYRKSTSKIRTARRNTSYNRTEPRVDKPSKNALSPRKRRTLLRENSSELIKNPKTFHIYNCVWNSGRVYPVMILGWDDLEPGNLDTLAKTGLLDDKAQPPSCYLYKESDDNTKVAIAGWAPGFEDGGPKMNQRKFPAMFFDPNTEVAWVSARCLSKFQFDRPHPPKRESHPFNRARRWIAKNNGFTTWEEFERARKGEAEDIEAVSFSPVSNKSGSGRGLDGSSEGGSDTESSAASLLSGVTEKELWDMRDKAGEIAGDSDYATSNMDNTPEDESDISEHDEPDGRPWTFYDLRGRAQAKPRRASPRTPALDEAQISTTTELSFREGKIAHVPAAPECPHSDDFLEKDDTTPEGLPQDETPQATTRSPPQDTDGNTPNAMSATNVHAMHTTKEAASPVGRPAFVEHITQSDNSSGAEKDSSTDSLKNPLPPVVGLGVTSKGVKRMRAEEQTETDINAPGQVSVKKVKTGVGVITCDDPVPVEVPIVPERSPSPAPPVSSLFKPRTPLGPAAFELSSYRKEPISWQWEGVGSPIKLYYGEGNTTIGTVDGPVSICIDPMRLKGLTREMIPESKGNSIVTLLGLDNSGDTPVRLVFGRAEDSKADIGKIQVRSLIRWLRRVNPAFQLPLD